MVCLIYTRVSIQPWVGHKPVDQVIYHGSDVIYTPEPIVERRFNCGLHILSFPPAFPHGFCSRIVMMALVASWRIPKWVFGGCRGRTSENSILPGTSVNKPLVGSSERRGRLNPIHLPVEEKVAPARRAAFVPARRPAPSRAAYPPPAPLSRGARSCHASQRAPGSPGHRSPLLPPHSHPPLKRRGLSMLAPSPSARTLPVPRTWAALPALLCASYASSSPFCSPRVA